MKVHPWVPLLAAGPLRAARDRGKAARGITVPASTTETPCRSAVAAVDHSFDDPAGVEPFDGQVTRSYNRAEGEEEEGGCMTMPVGLLQHPLALFAGIALLFGLRRRERR